MNDLPANPTPPETWPPKGFCTPSDTKLVVLSVCSFGIYQAYWFYKNWQALNTTSGKKVIAWLYASFYPVLANDCFKKIQNVAEECGIKSRWDAKFLAAVYFLMLLAAMLVDSLWFLSTLSFLPILPSNRMAREVNERFMPPRARDSKFSFLDWIVIVIGGLLFLLTVAAPYLLPDLNNSLSLFGGDL